MKNKSKQPSILNKINLGWNLGNFLDSHDKSFCWENTKSKNIQNIVNLWHNPIFNLKCLDTLKNKGINCIRIPITWCNFINIYKNNISISRDFISYLTKIIDSAIEKDFVVIIDMHHDDQTWLKISCPRNEFSKICKRYRNLWKIIAYHFKDYSQNLIFEGMNEIVDRSNPNKYDWVGKNKIFFKRLKKLYRIFINSVRRYSSNNKQRTLMISTYGAQIHKNALVNFSAPKDRNIIVDLHYYSNLTNSNEYDDVFKYVKKLLINKNIPIILGEIGVKKGCENTIDVLTAFTNYAKSINLKYILWDNGKSRKFIDREAGNINDIYKGIF